jgi:hypothetical protein
LTLRRFSCFRAPDGHGPDGRPDRDRSRSTRTAGKGKRGQEISGSTSSNTNHPGIALSGGYFATNYPLISLNNGGYGLYLSGGSSAVLPNAASMVFDTSAGMNFKYGASTAMILNTSGNLGIGTVTPVTKLDVNGDINFAGNIFQNGALFVHNLGNNNTAVSQFALDGDDGTGANNTAIGSGALNLNYSGSGNTGVGAYALLENTTGSANTALAGV